LSGSDVIAAEPSPSGEAALRRGPWLQALARFRRRPLGLVALLVVVAFAVVAGLADVIAPYPAARLFVEYLNRPQPPSFHGGHLLGTDVLGHDYLTQLLYAVRESMVGALVCGAGATVIGVVVGAAAGYLGGRVDALVGWLTGVVVTMPALALLVLVVVYNAPVAPFWFGVTLMLYLWTAIARVVRADFVTLRAREFVDAAHAAGASGLRVVVRHLLPNTLGSVIVAATATIGQSIVIIATVDFFNYGSQNSDTPTLGGLVADATRGVGLAATPWWLYAIPSIALGLLLVCVNFAGDSLDDAFNPAQR
jgi:ABC-type dipeptide/oligopeptide/nickel transport system permease subunit